MTMESVAGKNPVTHVGKLYNILAALIAYAVVENISDVAEAQCQLVSRIGQPLDRPESIVVRLYLTGKRGIDHLRPDVMRIVEAELATADLLAERIVNESIAIGRWPLTMERR
jgi:S-adenosylmethionine synthetase